MKQNKVNDEQIIVGKLGQEMFKQESFEIFLF